MVAAAPATSVGRVAGQCIESLLSPPHHPDPHTHPPVPPTQGWYKARGNPVGGGAGFWYSWPIKTTDTLTLGQGTTPYGTLALTAILNTAPGKTVSSREGRAGWAAATCHAHGPGWQNRLPCLGCTACSGAQHTHSSVAWCLFCTLRLAPSVVPPLPSLPCPCTMPSSPCRPTPPCLP